MRLVFTAYQRPFYWEPVLTQWKTVRGFHDWTPTVFLEPSPSREAMIRISHEAGVYVHANPRRNGVLHNPWVALNTAFEHWTRPEFVVLAEEDILPSDDILEYFTWAADEYRNDSILAICAASFHETVAPENEYRVQQHKQFCPLIWGTWRDRWEYVLRDTWDHDYSSGTPDAPQSGWDWNINLRIMQGWDIISPWASRSTHIGEHLGVHTTQFSFPGSVAKTYQPHREPSPYYR